MKKRVRHVLVIATLVMGGMIATQGAALADEPFLCPVVGDGVLNADAHNGDNGVSAIQPPVGTSFLPGGGNNQAGANSNTNAHNTSGPGNPDAGPGGGNSDFSPIWPG